MPKLRVVTLNLLYQDAQRRDRLNLVVEEIKKLKPDAVFLQEVHIDAQVHEKLAKLLPGYHQSIGRRGGNRSWEALMILSRQKPAAQKHLALSQNRAAHQISIKLGSTKLNLVNAHLHHGPLTDKNRRTQVEKVLKFTEAPAIVAGDFNALPSYSSIKLMRQRFNSAYQSVHGQEPDWTYPTPLGKSAGLRNFLQRKATRAIRTVSGRVNQQWGGAIDYVFVEQGIKVKDCRVVFDKPSPDDSKLYASDHFGLVADLEV